MDDFLIVGEIDRMLVNSDPDKQEEAEEQGEEA